MDTKDPACEPKAKCYGLYILILGFVCVSAIGQCGYLSGPEKKGGEIKSLKDKKVEPKKQTALSPVLTTPTEQSQAKKKDPADVSAENSESCKRKLERNAPCSEDRLRTVMSRDILTIIGLLMLSSGGWR